MIVKVRDDLIMGIGLEPNIEHVVGEERHLLSSPPIPQYKINGDWYAAEHFIVVEEQQVAAQRKTKDVEMSKENWEKYKDNCEVFFKGNKCVKFVPMFNESGNQGYALYQTEQQVIEKDDFINYYSVWAFTLRVPVIAKRIPFDPSLKGAKVIFKGFELSEWHVWSSGIVSAVGKNGIHYSQLLPSSLEMEIEE